MLLLALVQALVGARRVMGRRTVGRLEEQAADHWVSEVLRVVVWVSWREGEMLSEVVCVLVTLPVVGEELVPWGPVHRQ